MHVVLPKYLPLEKKKQKTIVHYFLQAYCWNYASCVYSCRCKV